MAHLGGVSGTLGRENAMRTPKRTATTAAALMIGVALVGFIMTFAASTKASINGAVDRDFHGDFVLDTGTFGVGGVSHTLATDLATRPEFSAVTASRVADAAIDGSVTQLNSWDTATLTSIFDIDPQQGDVTGPRPDGIAVEDGYAAEHGWTLGSTVPVTFAEGDTTLTVKAIYGDGTWTGSAFVDHAVLELVRHRPARRQGLRPRRRLDRRSDGSPRARPGCGHVPERRGDGPRRVQGRPRPATSTRCST